MLEETGWRARKPLEQAIHYERYLSAGGDPQRELAKSIGAFLAEKPDWYFDAKLNLELREQAADLTP